MAAKKKSSRAKRKKTAAKKGRAKKGRAKKAAAKKGRAKSKARAAFFFARAGTVGKRSAKATGERKEESFSDLRRIGSAFALRRLG